MFAAGVDFKSIQMTLRHSQMSTTADVYAHVLEEVQRQAANQMDAVLRDLGARSVAPAATSGATSRRRSHDLASALGGIRTPNLLIRSQMLYPLSYERRVCASQSRRRPGSGTQRC